MSSELSIIIVMFVPLILLMLILGLREYVRRHPYRTYEVLHVVKILGVTSFVIGICTVIYSVIM